MANVKDIIINYMVYFIGMIIIGALAVFVLIFKPIGIAPAILDPRLGPTAGNYFNLLFFGLGLDTTVIIWTIGIYLLYRWLKGGRSNTSLLIWSLSFFLYSITFVAHIFKGLGFWWANENFSPEFFFLWRWGMILWAGGSLYGILRILVKKKALQIIPSAVVIAVGFAWFFYGLFVIRDIEWMMYGFLFMIWIPICFSISYVFLIYGRRSGYSGPKILFLGYLGLTITYMAWAPWHFGSVIHFYFTWYFLFLLSLVPILVGFVLLSRESEEK